jgi:hypothetical protein
MITTATRNTASELQTAQGKTTSIIPLLREAGFDSIKPNTAQQKSLDKTQHQNCSSRTIKRNYFLALAASRSA